MPFDWSREFDIELDVHDAPATRLLQQAMLVHAHCSDLPSQRDAAQPILQKALEMMGACQHVVDTIGMFSDNEDKDDIPTCNIRFLLVPYLTGELMAQTREREPRPRLMALSLACRQFNAFLKHCRLYGLMDRSVLDALELAESGEQLDPRIARVQKIDRKRQEMLLAATLPRLMKEQEQAEASEAGQEDGSGSFDEEAERKLWTLTVRHACLKCIDELTCLAQEQEILSGMLKRLNDDPGEAELQAQEEAEEEMAKQKALMRSRLLKIAGEIGSNTVSREQTRADVFRPTNQPTYTVEQFGEMEFREAQERDARTKANEAARAAHEASRDPDEVEEEAVMKQREWDDWKDDHPTGYGNSKLRPCAT